ncbi:hypothetical protein ACIPJK_23740 [Streptomyces roseus]|uniref:hypothetical protein n=1 Tax=Streptomyces roseus TaxID=66430 RepID=UPI0038195CBC
MFTLLLVLAGLTAWAALAMLLGLLLGRAIRRGEQQARDTRKARHAAAHPTVGPHRPPPENPMTDQPRLTPNPDGGVILHLPNINYLDTQVWSIDIGLTQAGLDDLRALLTQDDGSQS